MRKLSMFVFLIAVCGLNLSFAQTPAVGSVERLDPALDAIVSSDATVEVLQNMMIGCWRMNDTTPNDHHITARPFGYHSLADKNSLKRSSFFGLLLSQHIG